MNNYLKIFGVLIFFLWFAGFVLFEVRMFRLVKDEETKTDAIIVLTGGNGRVKEGISLLKNHMGEKLLISGVSKETTLEDILKMAGFEDEAQNLKEKITLGYEALDTKGNAIETKKWVDGHGFKSIRIVTSDYHLLRSLAELSNLINDDVQIIPHPIKQTGKKHFGQNKQFSEYHKYLYVLFTNLFASIFASMSDVEHS